MDFKVIPAGQKFEGAVLLTGFHGIGYTGYWTVKYLIQKLEASRVAFVDSDSASPVCSNNGGKLVTPYEFYRSGGDLLLFKVEVPPYRGSEIEFYRSLCEWIMSAGFREVALIGGLDANLRTDDSSFRLVHTSAYKKNDLLKNARLLEDEQIIVGPVAIMLNYFESYDYPAYAILAYSSTDRVDPRAAVSSIEVLSKIYDFHVDIEPLLKGVQAAESEIIGQDRKIKKSESIYT
jgi:predicted ATP-grasp superfamily ATP-dependent carboligase